MPDKNKKLKRQVTKNYKAGKAKGKNVMEKKAEDAGYRNRYKLEESLRGEVGEYSKVQKDGSMTRTSYPPNRQFPGINSVKPQAPLKKSKQRIEQDYARNAIADYESGYKKAAKYEKKRELEVAAGEGPKMMKSPMKLESAAQERKDLMMDMPIDKRAAAKMAKSPMEMAGKSPMKMGGSWMSKHSSPAKMYGKKK